MQAPDKNKMSSVENALNQIHRQFGKGSIMRLGTQEAELVPVIPTGALSLDIALGVGGLPRGRVTEIYGPESSGKTTLALHVIAEAQKRGGQAAFIDAEHALDTSYAERLGVNIDDLLVSQPDFGEQALEIAEILIRSGGVDVIVIDSVAALVPRAEIDGNVGDSHVGLQARLMSQAMRKFTGLFHQYIGHAIAHEYTAKRQVARGDALRKRHEVGLRPVIVGAEPLAGPAEAADNLVGNQQDAVIVADALHLGPVAVRGNDHPAGSLYRLADERGHLVGAEFNYLVRDGLRGDTPELLG